MFYGKMSDSAYVACYDTFKGVLRSKLKTNKNKKNYWELRVETFQIDTKLAFLYCVLKGMLYGMTS